MSVAAAAITAGGQLLGSIIGAGSSANLNRKNRRHQELMWRQERAWATEDYEKQKADNIALWEMENEYNSPDAQRRRLESAGYNPALALGDVNSTGAAGSLESAPDIKSSHIAPYEATRSGFEGGLSALGAIIGAQKALAENKGITLDNELKETSLPWDAQKRKEEARSSRLEADYTDNMVKLTQARVITESALERNLRSQAALNESLKVKAEQDTATSAAQESYYGASATNLESQTAANYQGIEESKSRVEVNNAEAAKLRAEEKRLRKDLEWYDELQRTNVNQAIAGMRLSESQKAHSDKSKDWIGRQNEPWWIGADEKPGIRFNVNPSPEMRSKSVPTFRYGR